MLSLNVKREDMKIVAKNTKTTTLNRDAFKTIHIVVWLKLKYFAFDQPIYSTLIFGFFVREIQKIAAATFIFAESLPLK